MAAAVGLALPMVASVAAQTATTGVGVISYWGSTDTALYDQLPASSLAVVNPDSGVFVEAGEQSCRVGVLDPAPDRAGDDFRTY